jgi:Rps23 Pro-64 3,4-dihydroxylase Tpa1-like proline 4-hydroxylase
MTKALLPLDPGSFLIETAQAKEIGASLAATYRNRTPFPYGCYDDFLDSSILEGVLEDLKSLPAPEASFNRAQERFKASYSPEKLPQHTRQLLYALNSKPFIAFLEALTGIKGLIPDPYYMGGGIHVVSNGGHLDIHADFNHHKIMNLERRINVLIYLNKDWKAEYGGSFEIWNDDMSARVESFEPIFNRMCCFNTTSRSWHGNPEPVNHPTGLPRQSIALYYYTATWSDLKKAHTTQFKPRPGSKDEVDRLVARQELVKDLLPPALYRRIVSKLHRNGL